MCPSFPPQGFTIKNFLERFNPAIGYPMKDGWVGDFFFREALTPTGWPTIYTEANVGGGSGAINTSGLYILTSGAAAGDDVDLRLSGMSLSRATTRTFNALRSIIGTLDYYTIFNLESVTLTEGFIGIMNNASAALTALPTTAAHVGVFWDASAQANFRMTSSDGTTQVNSDITVPLDTVQRCLHIRITGLNTGIVELLDAGTFLPISGTTVTISALGSVLMYMPHWFIQTETTAARALATSGWMAKIS